MATKPKRGGEPTRFDFSKLKPPESWFRDDGAWEREQAQHAALQEQYARERNLERQPELRVTDAVLNAIVRGQALRSTAALDVVQRWYRSSASNPTLIVAGNPGCGKSVAAAWLIAESGGIWLRAERARKAFASNFGPDLDKLSVALSGRMLVVEDVGTEIDPQSFGGFLCELLEQRKSSRHRTLITTNLKREGWTTRYGDDERIASRLGKHGAASETVHWVSVEGPDMRARPGSKERKR
jgi:hypothetical protein